MKANEVPEKIHVSIVPNSLNSYTYITCGKDFPNAVEGILVVLCCYIGIKRAIDKALKWFKYAIIGAI